MKILITGGAGYIGSHTAVVLLEAGYSLVLIDNFYNSQPMVLDRIREISGKNFSFHEMDACDAEAVDRLFCEEHFDGVIHFAGMKAVGESVAKPLQYYRNNLLSTITLADACVRHSVPRFVFSSSATVYGDNTVPFHEGLPLLPTTNPYGETKAMSERILTDAAKAHPFLQISLLRYFNPVGAHPSGLIGEDPNGIPNNLLPNVTRAVTGRVPYLRIFGNDYPTPDGTGIRDYIHVMDLAEGHLAALEHLTPGVHLHNLGSGQGTSVLELIHAFEEATGETVPYRIEARRPGDIATCYADASKANRELNWAVRRNIVDICRDAWRFECYVRDHNKH